MAWTGVHGADVPVGTDALAEPIVHANGRVAPLFQAEGTEKEESRQEVAAESEEAAREEKGNKEETPSVITTLQESRGSVSMRRSRGHVKETTTVRRSSCVVFILGIACSAPAPREQLGNPQQEIAAMLQRSASDWNRGDLAGFMSDYARDSLTSYMAGGHVQYGWQALYDRYQKNYFAPGKSRDSLSFDELHVRALAADLAVATARFKLTRRDSVVASGPFTLILQRQGDRWRILHDHTSSDPK